MAQILRVSIRGGAPNGEVWSVNPCWEINGSAGEDVSPAEALTIATAIDAVTMPTAVLQGWAAATTLTGCRVEARTLNGGLETQAEHVRAVAVPGTSSVILPGVSSVVLSLRTPGVGPSARGRLYWPLTGESLATATFRIGGSRVTAILGGLKTYLSGVEAAIKVTLPEANLTVWSRKTANFHNVTNIQMGDVVDTQRRRRDTLIEAYQSLSYP